MRSVAPLKNRGQNACRMKQQETDSGAGWCQIKCMDCDTPVPSTPVARPSATSEETEHLKVLVDVSDRMTEHIPTGRPYTQRKHHAKCRKCCTCLCKRKIKHDHWNKRIIFISTRLSQPRSRKLSRQRVRRAHRLVHAHSLQPI